jgi:hypothetical protein
MHTGGRGREGGEGELPHVPPQKALKDLASKMQKNMKIEDPPPLDFLTTPGTT